MIRRLLLEMAGVGLAVVSVPAAFGVWANAAVEDGVTALSWPAAIEPAPQSRPYGHQSHFALGEQP